MALLFLAVRREVTVQVLGRLQGACVCRRSRQNSGGGACNTAVDRRPALLRQSWQSLLPRERL